MYVHRCIYRCALHCRRILAWLGLAILLASLAGMAFHTRSMWLPPLSDALYGTRHGFRVNRYGRQVDDMAADHEEGDVHLISIDSQRSDGRGKSGQGNFPHVAGAAMPDEALMPSGVLAVSTDTGHALSHCRRDKDGLSASSIPASSGGVESVSDSGQLPGVGQERSASRSTGTASQQQVPSCIADHGESVK